MPNVDSIISAASGLLGALIGAGAALLTQHLARRSELAKERKSLAAAIAAEIEAYLDLMNRRDMLGSLDLLTKRLGRGEQLSIKHFALPDEKPLDQFLIGPSVVTSIGLLGDLAADVAKFYTLVAGVRTTGIFAARGAYDAMQPEARGTLVKQERDVLATALDLGRELVPRLRVLR